MTRPHTTLPALSDPLAGAGRVTTDRVPAVPAVPAAPAVPVQGELFEVA